MVDERAQACDVLDDLLGLERSTYAELPPMHGGQLGLPAHTARAFGV